MLFQPCRALPLALAAVLAATCFCRADVPSHTLTMDDLPFQPIHGLVHPLGVEFGFTVGGLPSLDANYRSGGPGLTLYTEDPSIEGSDAGVMSLMFAAPTTVLEFGVVRSLTSRLSEGAVVELFAPSGMSRGTTTVSLLPLVSFSEGAFGYDGPAIQRATVSFPPAGLGAFGRFAFDNLTFNVVPEPGGGTLVLLAVGAAAGPPTRRRRRGGSARAFLGRNGSETRRESRVGRR